MSVGQFAIYPYWTGLTLISWKICILYSVYGIYTQSVSWPRWATSNDNTLADTTHTIYTHSLTYARTQARAHTHTPADVYTVSVSTRIIRTRTTADNAPARPQESAEKDRRLKLYK